MGDRRVVRLDAEYRIGRLMGRGARIDALLEDLDDELDQPLKSRIYVGPDSKSSIAVWLDWIADRREAVYDMTDILDGALPLEDWDD